eukprot:TRINITY_DN1579_c0_g8_i1.p1 TRINITY_DN1579_c0_g8~~TRINITY_DN1579_c0_g8_i1.p1  ORF type:complete len:360 (-),score=64.57 TRINITY_DN1579_c0_g8_i1:246-1325(-)
MSVHVTLVRHGETVGNVQHLIDGHSGGQITQLGYQQALKLGERLASQRIDAIYVSDLRRTRQTAALICSKHSQVPVFLSDALREKGGGLLEGSVLGTNEAEAKRRGEPLRTFRAPNAESWQDVFTRAQKFWQLLYAVHVTKRPPECFADLFHVFARHAQIASSVAISASTAEPSSPLLAPRALPPPSTAATVPQSRRVSQVSAAAALPQRRRSSSVDPTRSSPRSQPPRALPPPFQIKSSMRKPSVGSAPRAQQQQQQQQQQQPVFHVLVVTHGGFIKEFMNFVQKRSGVLLAPNNARNTSIWTVQFRLDNASKPFRVLCENDVAHLAGMGKARQADHEPSDAGEVDGMKLPPHASWVM